MPDDRIAISLEGRKLQADADKVIRICSPAEFQAHRHHSTGMTAVVSGFFDECWKPIESPLVIAGLDEEELKAIRTAVFTGVWNQVIKDLGLGNYRVSYEQNPGGE
jgi:hypothetical protein